MQDIKNKIEVVLYMTGRFMSIEEIAEYCGIGSVGSVKEAMKSLMEDYVKRDSGLTIYEEQQKYKLHIKKDYTHLSTKLVNNSELDGPTQATLAIIAYKQPAVQADVVKMRGNVAYDHIRTLKEQEFITSEPHGRTRVLKLTSKFYDYFDVVEQEDLKRKFKAVADKEEAHLHEEVKESAKEKILRKLAEEDEEVEKKKREIVAESPSFDPNDFGS